MDFGVAANERSSVGERRNWARAVSCISLPLLRKNCSVVSLSETRSCLRVHSGLMKRGSGVGSNSSNLQAATSYNPGRQRITRKASDKSADSLEFDSRPRSTLTLWQQVC